MAERQIQRRLRTTHEVLEVWPIVDDDFVAERNWAAAMMRMNPMTEYLYDTADPDPAAAPPVEVGEEKP